MALHKGEAQNMTGGMVECYLVRVAGSSFLVLRSWFFVPGSSFLVLRSWFFVLRLGFRVLSLGFPDAGTDYRLPITEY